MVDPLKPGMETGRASIRVTAWEAICPGHGHVGPIAAVALEQACPVGCERLNRTSSPPMALNNHRDSSGSKASWLGRLYGRRRGCTGNRSEHVSSSRSSQESEQLSTTTRKSKRGTGTVGGDVSPTVTHAHRASPPFSDNPAL